MILLVPAPWFGTSPLVQYQPASPALHLPRGLVAAGLGFTSHGRCVSPLALSGFLHGPAALVRGRNASRLRLHLSTNERRSRFSLGERVLLKVITQSPSENTHVAVVCVLVYCPFRWEQLWKLSVMGFSCPFIKNKNSELLPCLQISFFRVIKSTDPQGVLCSILTGKSMNCQLALRIAAH